MGIAGTILLVLLGGGGLVLLLSGAIGRRVAIAPRCRRCGFDLRGRASVRGDRGAEDGDDADDVDHADDADLDPASEDRCPECGRDLAQPRAIRRTRRRRQAWRVVAGAVLLLAGGVLLPAIRSGRVVAAMPAGWKSEVEYRFGGDAARQVIAREAMSALRASFTNPSDAAADRRRRHGMRVAALAVERQRRVVDAPEPGADLRERWSAAESVLLEIARLHGVLDVEQETSIVEHLCRVSVRPASGLRRGEGRFDVSLAGIPGMALNLATGSFTPRAVQARVVEVRVDGRPLHVRVLDDRGAFIDGRHAATVSRGREIRVSAPPGRPPLVAGRHRATVVLALATPLGPQRAPHAWTIERVVTLEVPADDVAPPVERLRLLLEQRLRAAVVTARALRTPGRFVVDVEVDLRSTRLVLPVERLEVSASTSPAWERWGQGDSRRGGVRASWVLDGPVPDRITLRVSPGTLTVRGSVARGGVFGDWSGPIPLDEPVEVEDVPVVER